LFVADADAAPRAERVVDACLFTRLCCAAPSLIRLTIIFASHYLILVFRRADAAARYDAVMFITMPMFR